MSTPALKPLIESPASDTKPRLTKVQHDVLEQYFLQQRKPTTERKKRLAEELDVPLDKINNWFQNRRAKVKQDRKTTANQFQPIVGLHYAQTDGKTAFSKVGLLPPFGIPEFEPTLDDLPQIEGSQVTTAPKVELELGVGARLLRACLDCLAPFAQHVDGLQVSKREKARLRRCHATLRLWADGHAVWSGELDRIMDHSKPLRDAMLLILNPLCKVVLLGLNRYVLPFSCDASIAQLSRTTAEVHDQTKWLLTRSDDCSSASDSESDASSNSLVAAGLKMIIEDVRMYTDCLLDMSTALKSLATDSTHASLADAGKALEMASHELASEQQVGQDTLQSSALEYDKQTPSKSGKVDTFGKSTDAVSNTLAPFRAPPSETIQNSMPTSGFGLTAHMATKTLQDQQVFNPTSEGFTSKGEYRGTVAIACVPCRSRHLKCDGGVRCSRCRTDNVECTYVKSRRGWKRVRRHVEETPTDRSSTTNGPAYPSGEILFGDGLSVRTNADGAATTSHGSISLSGLPKTQTEVAPPSMQNEFSRVVPYSSNTTGVQSTLQVAHTAAAHLASRTYPPVNSVDQNPPCNTLYVGNLPMLASEDELLVIFSKQRGFKRLCFRSKQNGPICFVEFESISFATKAMNELYGYMLHNCIKGGIRLSFSKNPLGVRSGQESGSQPGQASQPSILSTSPVESLFRYDSPYWPTGADPQEALLDVQEHHMQDGNTIAPRGVFLEHDVNE